MILFAQKIASITGILMDNDICTLEMFLLGEESDYIGMGLKKPIIQTMYKHARSLVSASPNQDRSPAPELTTILLPME